jgi:hypothetical protein
MPAAPVDERLDADLASDVNRPDGRGSGFEAM